MSKKIEELLPDILRKLSSGIAVSTAEIEKRYGVSSSSVRAHLRELKNNFLKTDIAYDAGIKKWVALRGGFLDKMLLKPEEIIILNSMLRGKERLGKSLANSIQNMVESYVKKTNSDIFKQEHEEEISEVMREKYALVHAAIESKLKLSMKFDKIKRVVYPYMIVNIEYYWYLLGYEESKDGISEDSGKIKFFTLHKIEDLEITEELFEYDFSDLGTRIKYIMNAYFSVSNPVTPVQLLVHKEIVEYIERAKFFTLWKKKSYETMIDDKKYVMYEVGTTDKYFRDITPTILKYLPNILVEKPDELKKQVMKKINEYKKIYEG